MDGNRVMLFVTSSDLHIIQRMESVQHTNQGNVHICRGNKENLKSTATVSGNSSINLQYGIWQRKFYSNFEIK